MTPTSSTCVVVADSARARLYMYRPPESDEILVEVEDLVNPSRRRLDSEVFTDTRPGLRQAQRGGPRHGVDDHRGDARDEKERTFAVDIIEHAARLSETLDRCGMVIIASPGMLGALRLALADAPAWVRERANRQFDRDLTSLDAARVHDWLAEAKVLPPRPRLGLPA
jgi:protein required for attachment to host cells